MAEKKPAQQQLGGRFEVRERADIEDQFTIVFSTDDAGVAHAAFIDSTTRQIYDTSSSSIVAEVTRLDRDDISAQYEYVLDEMFSASLAGLPYSILTDNPEIDPVQTDLFNAGGADKSSIQPGVVQLDFEPTEAPSNSPDSDSLPPDMEAPPLSAYEIDEADPSAEEVPSIDDQAATPASIAEGITFRGDGRWQLIGTDVVGEHSVLFATDDAHEAEEALSGYDPEPGMTVRVFDAETEEPVFWIEGEGPNAKPVVMADFQRALDAPGPDFAEAAEQAPGADKGGTEAGIQFEDLDHEVGKENEPSKDPWVSRTPPQRSVDNANVMDPNVDDEIFETMNWPANGGAGRGPAGREVSVLEGLGGAAITGLKSLFSRKEQGVSGDEHQVDGLGSAKGALSQSLGKQFHHADPLDWKSSRTARELTVIEADMGHAVESLKRLAQTDYSKLARTLEQSDAQPTDEQLLDLARMKDQPDYAEASADVDSFVRDVDSRIARMLGDDDVPDIEKERISGALDNWSEEMKGAAEELPSSDFKMDLLERIRKMIDLIMEKLCPTKTQSVSPTH